MIVISTLSADVAHLPATFTLNVPAIIEQAPAHLIPTKSYCQLRLGVLSGKPDTLTLVLADERVAYLPDLLTTATESNDLVAGKIMAFGKLPGNWDHEGAVAASNGAVQDALSLLDALPASLERPKAMPLPDGHIALYWDRGETYAEIGFDGSGRYYAFAEAPGFESVHLDDRELSAGFPVEVIELLAPVAGVRSA